MAIDVRITELATAPIKERGPIEVGFAFSCGKQAIEGVELELATPIGTLRTLWPAALAGIEGAAGSGRVTLDLLSVPGGRCVLSLVPLTAGGERGAGASAELLVPQTKSRPPKLAAASLLDPRLRRPTGADRVFVRADLAVEPGEAEVSAVWTWMRGPGGSEKNVMGEVSEVGVVPCAERVQLAALHAGHAAGHYEIAVRLVDAAGQTSEPVLVPFDVLERGGAAGPTVLAFKPARAAAGAEVLVRGEGFDDEELTVQVGGVAAGVLHAEGKLLRIRMPELDAPGRIVVSGARGIGHSEQWLAPQPRLRVWPEAAQVAEGGTVNFAAVVHGSTEGKVRWALRSGAKNPGSISAAGVYTPPAGGLRDEVIVTATHAADRSLSASALVRGGPQPAARGPLRIGRQGGSVRSQDDSCVLGLPEGAVPRLRALAIEPEVPRDGDEPEGRLVVAQVRIEGAPRELGAAAELTLRLRHALLPGQEVRLRYRDSPTEPWRDLPPLPVDVLPGSEALRLRLEQLHAHFQGTIDYAPKPPRPPSFAPSITGVEPSAIDEGATAAVLVTGHNFVPGVSRVTVHAASGQIEPRVEVRQVHVTADGSKLGVTLKAGVMTNLAEGARLILTLRVTTPTGAANTRLDILGHDELELSGTTTLTGPGVFSRVRVAPGATVRIAHGAAPIRIAAFETFTVGGASGRATVETLTTSGAAGRMGTAATLPGAGGSGAFAPGAGAAGNGGNGGAGGFSSSFGGGAGSSGGHSPGNSGGAGGAGGRPASLLGNATDGATGSSARLTFLGSATNFGAGAGGGGGGGGGGEGAVFRSFGGGGGGGGAGGGAFRLAAGEEVRITGRVQANGGDGGGGAFPLPVGFPPSAPLWHAGCGGGGGSGSGGSIGLHGLRELAGEALAVGGANGADARFADAVITTPDTRTPLQRLLAQPQNGQVHMDGVPNSLAGTVAPAPMSVPDLDYRANLVSPSAQITMTGFGAGQLLVSHGADTDVVQVSAPVFSVNVPLAAGFNVIEGALAALNSPGDISVLVRADPMRRRRVLFLPGTVPAFTFNCTITPAAPVVATERSVALTATVSGTAQTAITWDVDGGAVNGSVSATGVYRAPCDVPAPGAATVRARSAFDPSRTAAVNVTVLPGIALTATAAFGTPAVAGLPSANVGRTVTVTIPAATAAATTERFAVAQNVVFETHSRDGTSGACTDGTTTVAGTAAIGLASLTVTVPPCAAPEQHLRVPGFGCARLQIVPRIQSLNRGTNIAPNMGINGSGFVCGATKVFFGTAEVPAAQVLSVDCGVILVGTRPAAGQAVTVRTAGGTSNAVT
ncbi:MAG: hypothetical protein JNL30_14130 [Rubrivivax sp.]|nr:hypothetical protein [Rubrivivax sp.]